MMQSFTNPDLIFIQPCKGILFSNAGGTIPFSVGSVLFGSSPINIFKGIFETAKFTMTGIVTTWTRANKCLKNKDSNKSMSRFAVTSDKINSESVLAKQFFFQLVNPWVFGNVFPATFTLRNFSIRKYLAVLGNKISGEIRNFFHVVASFLGNSIYKRIAPMATRRALRHK